MQLIDPLSFVSFFLSSHSFFNVQWEFKPCKEKSGYLISSRKVLFRLNSFLLALKVTFYILVITNEIYTSAPCVLYIICIDFYIKMVIVIVFILLKN